MSSIGVLERSGFDKNQRFFLFFLVCIPLRLSLALFAYAFRGSTLVKALLLASGIVSVILNIRNISGDPWWSRRFHLVSSISLVGTLFGTMIGSLVKAESNLDSIPPTILLLDVLYGVVAALILSRPFE